MALQRSPIDGSVLNGAALVVVFASAVLAGAGTVSASAYRNTPITATLTGSASIPYSTLWQVHSARANAVQPATVGAYSSVKKQATASASAVSTFAAKQMAVPGGAELEAESSFGPPDATLVQPISAVGVSTSVFSSEAYRWAWGAASIRPTSRLIAEPGIKLNGDSFWTFEASAGPIGRGAVSFTASGVRIVSYDSVFAGIASWQPSATYKRRASVVMTATSAVASTTRQRHLTPVTPAASVSTAQATGTRYAKVQGVLGANTTLHATGKGYFAGHGAFTVGVSVLSDATRIVFHSYPTLTAESELAVLSGPTMQMFAQAEPMGFALAEMSALVNIRSLDVVTFLRAPETRDYLRAAETRDFTRYAT